MLPCNRFEAVQAIKNRGLLGDRYFKETGHWQSIEACQVTLISDYDLRYMQKYGKAQVGEGQHRRNLIVAGIKTQKLENKRFRIGDALFCLAQAKTALCLYRFHHRTLDVKNAWSPRWRLLARTRIRIDPGG